MKTCWRSPANIAFVKYWGKKGHQLPANPSVSMTLDKCYTETAVEFTESSELSVSLRLAGVAEEKFAAKIKKYLEGLSVKNVSVVIDTKNTFPHGAGIASSASGLSAFSLGLTEYLHPELSGAEFFMKASDLSRLASGSACRSVYPGFASWGKSELEGSSDEFATPFSVHESLRDLRDSVLVISSEEKSVSSRAGHDRMVSHPFAEARFVQAKKHFTDIIPALKAGDMDRVGEILEIEALSLHAMMMTSADGFMLMKPNSITAMERVREFRRATKLPVYFTLDAGPNLHLMYPASVSAQVESFIQRDLTSLCSTVIHDQAGLGPSRC